MTNAFRLISLLEGLSFVTLLSLVYFFESREYIFSIGMGHGILFLIYFVASLMISHKKQWSVLVWVMVLLCSVIPFAFVPLEIWLRNAELEPAAEAS